MISKFKVLKINSTKEKISFFNIDYFEKVKNEIASNPDEWLTNKFAIQFFLFLLYSYSNNWFYNLNFSNESIEILQYLILFSLIYKNCNIKNSLIKKKYWQPKYRYFLFKIIWKFYYLILAYLKRYQESRNQIKIINKKWLTQVMSYYIN